MKKKLEVKAPVAGDNVREVVNGNVYEIRNGVRVKVGIEKAAVNSIAELLEAVIKEETREEDCGC